MIRSISFLGAAVLWFSVVPDLPAQTGREVACQANRGEATQTVALDQPARLVVEAESIRIALSKLRERSGVPLSFGPTRMPFDTRLSCPCEGATVREALNILLEGTSLRYQEADGHILVFDPPPPTREHWNRRLRSRNVHSALGVIDGLRQHEKVTVPRPIAVL